MKPLYNSVPFRLGIAVNVVCWILINLVDYNANVRDFCFDCAQEYGKPFRMFKSGSFCCSSYVVWDGIISNVVIIIAGSLILGLIFHFSWIKARRILQKSEMDVGPAKNVDLSSNLTKKSISLGTPFLIAFSVNALLWVLINFVNQSSQLKKVCTDCYRGFGIPFPVYEPESIVGSAHWIWEGLIANLVIIIVTGAILGLVLQPKKKRN